VEARGKTKVSKLAEADLQEVNAVVSDPKFIAGLKSGFECEAMPTDAGMSIELQMRDGSSLSQSTRPCLDRSSPLERLLDAIGKYSSQ
jgi:hypothetical protein